MTSRLITPQLAEQFKQYPLYSQDGKKLNARNINIIKKIENEHDKAIAYHDTVAPKMEEKSSKKELLFIRYNKERSIYFFYWLFKFARSVVVKSRSAFYYHSILRLPLYLSDFLFTIHHNGSRL